MVYIFACNIRRYIKRFGEKRNDRETTSNDKFPFFSFFFLSRLICASRESEVYINFLKLKNSVLLVNIVTTLRKLT